MEAAFLEDRKHTTSKREVTPGSYWKLLPLKMGSTLHLRERSLQAVIGSCFPPQGKQLPITARSDLSQLGKCASHPQGKQIPITAWSDLSQLGSVLPITLKDKQIPITAWMGPLHLRQRSLQAVIGSCFLEDGKHTT